MHVRIAHTLPFKVTTQTESEKESTGRLWDKVAKYCPAKAVIDETFNRDVTQEVAVDSLAMHSSDTIGLTEFPVEAKVETLVEPDAHMYTSTQLPDEFQDIKRYFERPRLVTTTTAATTRSSLASFNVNNPITQFWPANAIQRLNGVYGYRCRLKWTVTLAATPFQQGMVALSWQYGTASNAGVNISRALFPPLVTNLPHTRLDFSDNTMAELDIPYLSSYEYFELANTSTSGGDNAANLYGFGVFGLTQILPYYTLTTVSAPVLRVYLSLHDMELFGAVPVAASAIIPQSGMTKHMDKQTNKTKTGSVSSFLNKTSKVADTVAVVGGLAGAPVLAATSATVGWLAGKLAHTAASLGYSKPVSEQPVCAMYPNDANYEFHVDQPTVDRVISPYQSNRLAVDDKQSGTDIDEMTLPFILGQYAQAYVGEISTTDGSGATLYATNLCPTSMWYRSRPTARAGGNLPIPSGASLTTNCFCPTPLCYLGQMFRYWRGSIKFRFSFAKTKFHAGRVMAAYIPSTRDVTNTGVVSPVVPTPEFTSGLLQPFQYSTVFDLRDDSSFEFIVPYVSTRPFISTLGSVGGVTLTVMDPLLVSGEITGTIPYLVEVCAGEDFELADFVGSGLAPASTINSAGLVAFQSGLTDDKVTQYTSGEKYSSCKELMMIPYTAAVTIGPGAFVKTTMPQFYYAPRITAAAPMPNNTTALAACSTQHCITSMYSFCAGGTTYGAYFTRPQDKLALFQQYLYDTNNPVLSRGDTRCKVGAHKTKIISTGYNASLYAKAPSYQKNVMIPTDRGSWPGNWTGTNEVIAGAIENPALYNFYAFNGAATNNIAYLTYAASDDARCWAYNGPPPCWLLQTTQTADLDAGNTGVWI